MNTCTQDNPNPSGGTRYTSSLRSLPGDPCHSLQMHSSLFRSDAWHNRGSILPAQIDSCDTSNSQTALGRLILDQSVNLETAGSFRPARRFPSDAGNSQLTNSMGRMLDKSGVHQSRFQDQPGAGIPLPVSTPTTANNDCLPASSRTCNQRSSQQFQSAA